MQNLTASDNSLDLVDLEARLRKAYRGQPVRVKSQQGSVQVLLDANWSGQVCVELRSRDCKCSCKLGSKVQQDLTPELAHQFRSELQQLAQRAEALAIAADRVPLRIRLLQQLDHPVQRALHLFA